MDIPPIRSYNQVRVNYIYINQYLVRLIIFFCYLFLQKDSESDYDDSMENAHPDGQAALPIEIPSTTESNNESTVKAEHIDYSLPEKVPDIEKVQSVFGNSFPFEDNPNETNESDDIVIKQEFEIKEEEFEEKEKIKIEEDTSEEMEKEETKIEEDTSKEMKKEVQEKNEVETSVQETDS